MGLSIQPKRHEQGTKSKEELTCSNCKTIFYLFPSQIKLGQGVYCSNKCKGEDQKIILNGSNNPNWKGGLVEKECQWCKKKYQVKIHRKDSSHFCSYECAGYHKSVYMKGRKPNLFTQVMKHNYLLTGLGYEKSLKNCVTLGTGHLKHEVAKMMVAYCIMDIGHDAYTEVRVKNGIIDVIDMQAKIGYEVENRCTLGRLKFKNTYTDGNILKQIIVIDISKLPLHDVKESFEYIKSKVLL